MLNSLIFKPSLYIQHSFFWLPTTSYNKHNTEADHMICSGQNTRNIFSSLPYLFVSYCLKMTLYTPSPNMLFIIIQTSAPANNFQHNRCWVDIHFECKQITIWKELLTIRSEIDFWSRTDKSLDWKLKHLKWYSANDEYLCVSGQAVNPMKFSVRKITATEKKSLIIQQYHVV